MNKKNFKLIALCAMVALSFTSCSKDDDPEEPVIPSEYIYATAVSMFKSVVAFILVLTVNKISKRMGETHLF